MAIEPTTDATPEPGKKPKVSITVDGKPLALGRTVANPAAAVSKQMEPFSKALMGASALSVPWNEQTLDAFARELHRAGQAYQARTFDHDFSKTPQGRQLALLTAQVDEMRMLREDARRDREEARRDRAAARRDRLWSRAIGLAGVLVGVTSFLVPHVR